MPFGLTCAGPANPAMGNATWRGGGSAWLPSGAWSPEVDGLPLCKLNSTAQAGLEWPSSNHNRSAEPSEEATRSRSGCRSSPVRAGLSRLCWSQCPRRLLPLNRIGRGWIRRLAPRFRRRRRAGLRARLLHPHLPSRDQRPKPLRLCSPAGPHRLENGNHRCRGLGLTRSPNLPIPRLPAALHSRRTQLLSPMRLRQSARPGLRRRRSRPSLTSRRARPLFLRDRQTRQARRSGSRSIIWHSGPRRTRPLWRRRPISMPQGWSSTGAQ